MKTAVGGVEGLLLHAQVDCFIAVIIVAGRVGPGAMMLEFVFHCSCSYVPRYIQRHKAGGTF